MLQLAGKPEQHGGHRARSPKRTVTSASRIRSRSPCHVNRNVNNIHNGDESSSPSSSETTDTDQNHGCTLNSGSSFLYTTVHFNKLKVSALIDTGSSVNIISEELYKSLPNSKKSDITVNIKDAIVLANNQKIDVIGTAMIKMTISGVHQNITSYILKMSSNPIILGTEYLTENKVILDFSNKTPVSLNSNIYCTKRTTIPPNSEIILWGKLHYGFYGMQALCVSSRYVLCKGILVSKAVVSIAKNKQVPIKILNPTNDCYSTQRKTVSPFYSNVTRLCITASQ